MTRGREIDAACGQLAARGRQPQRVWRFAVRGRIGV
jgi:hypothetical protein